MPILSYFAVVGSVLVALLFVADATLEKSGPLPFNNESVGLPKPWQPDTKGSILTATSAPEPDMASAGRRRRRSPDAADAPQCQPRWPNGEGRGRSRTDGEGRTRAQKAQARCRPQAAAPGWRPAELCLVAERRRQRLLWRRQFAVRAVLTSRPRRRADRDRPHRRARPPCVRSGRIMVHDSQTLSLASAPRLAFWMLWMPATARL